MLNVELPNGLNGASLIQHSTFNIKFNIQHSTLNIKFNTQHSTLNIQHLIKRLWLKY